MKGGAIGNDYFRAGYSGTFGVIIALAINAIILLALESAITMTTGYRWGFAQMAIFFGIYVTVLSLYVSGAMDKISL